ncbi:uncharacterized protein DS421_13g419760 [Arachis hypogaea]|nr:uncharacterized protein DS421_13g419760 [Arachis hypogaea]
MAHQSLNLTPKKPYPFTTHPTHALSSPFSREVNCVRAQTTSLESSPPWCSPSVNSSSLVIPIVVSITEPLPRPSSMIARTTSLEKKQKQETHLRARIVADVPLYPSVPAALCFPLPVGPSPICSLLPLVLFLGLLSFLVQITEHRTKGGEAKERPARRTDTAVKSCRRNALHLHSGFFLSGTCILFVAAVFTYFNLG